MTFERKIMRKIYGPTRTEDGYWRIKTDQEINDILKGQNIIGFQFCYQPYALINAKQAKLYNNFRNTKCKLLRTNADK